MFNHPVHYLTHLDCIALKFLVTIIISVPDFEDLKDEYEDSEAWKKHLPKFQRGMKCEDHVDCDRHNVS